MALAYSPKVSVITVCFNSSAVIRPTIESVIAQDYPNIEYLLIDGLSKDNTVDIIRSYGQRITKWISEKDKSHFDAMNKGLALATGEYVWFMHAGDRIPTPQTLSQAMEKHNGADFIYGDTIMVTEDGQQRPWYKKKPKATQISWKSFRNGMVICHQSMIVKRAKAPEYDISTWKVSNDHDWTIRLLKECLTFCDTGIVMCHYLEGGISYKNRKKSFKERFEILLKHFGLIPTIWEHIRIAFQALLRGRIS
jgi:glycosyltransferase involved in cell wall biosynthesis